MTVQILSVNLDSLYLSVQGEWQPAMKEIVKAAKEQAQTDDEKHTFLFRDNRVAGGGFFVSRSGRSRDYAYQLYNSRFRLQLSTRGGNRPIALVQVRSDLLYEYELPAINTMILRLLSNFFDEYTFMVGRADICCDFQQAGFEMPHPMDALFRAKKWTQHGEYSQTTGLTYGVHGGALQVQLYRKSETLAKDGKQWMFEVWAAENERFDPELTAYRVEVRFYRDGLRMMKDPEGGALNTLWELHSSLADLLEYAIGPEKPWIRFVDKEHRIASKSERAKNSSRWDDAEWWHRVQAAFLTLKGSQARKRVNDELRFHFTSAIERAAAHLRTAQAIARVAGWEIAIAPGEFARDSLRAFYSESPLDWSEGVNEKVRQLQGILSGHVAEVA